MFTIKMLARLSAFVKTRITAKKLAVAELAKANARKAAERSKAAAKLRIEIAQATYKFETKQAIKIQEIHLQAEKDQAALDKLLK